MYSKKCSKKPAGKTPPTPRAINVDPPAITIDPPSSPTPESSSVNTPKTEETKRSLLEVPDRDFGPHQSAEENLSGSASTGSSAGAEPLNKKKAGEKFVSNIVKKTRKVMSSVVERARSLSPSRSPKKKGESS